MDHQQDIAATLSANPNKLAELWADDAVRLGPGPAEVGQKLITLHDAETMEKRRSRSRPIRVIKRDQTQSTMEQKKERDEDLSFYEGAGEGPNVAKVKEALEGI